MSTKEKNLINTVLSELQPNERLFRCNSGMAWSGEIIKKTPDSITLKNPRPFHGLPQGTPDLCGFKSVVITPDMVGQTVAVFYAVECKTGKLQLSDMQKKFRDIIVKMGGIFREVRGD